MASSLTFSSDIQPMSLLGVWELQGECYLFPDISPLSENSQGECYLFPDGSPMSGNSQVKGICSLISLLCLGTPRVNVNCLFPDVSPKSGNSQECMLTVPGMSLLCLGQSYTHSWIVSMDNSIGVIMAPPEH